MEKNRTLSLIAGPLVFLIFCFLPIPGLEPIASKTIGVIAWMLIWWITEAVPMGTTSLLPVAVFPLFGILSIEKTCLAYGNKYVFLFMSGFIIALAMEKWNLHRRLALSIVHRTGLGADRIILGFYTSSYLISMWISNTATALMMFPIASSVIALLLHEDKKLHGKKEKNFALTLMLSIAYGASIGGIATLVGSPPNAAMAGILSSDTFNTTVSFFDWLKFGLPFSFILFISSYFLLVKVIFPNKLGEFSIGNNIIRDELDKLGSWKKEEKRVFVVFVLTAILWILQEPIAKWFPSENIQVTDVGIGMVAAIMLFIIPSSKPTESRLLEWKDTEKLPWGVLLMFGGGLALSEAFKFSGLIEKVTELMSGVDQSNTFVFVSLLCLVGLVLTALMSNLAMVNIFVPIVAALAVGAGVDPILFAIPVTIAASCDFMFPMSTPPNAIAYSSGHIKAADMLKAGIILNILSFILLSALIWVATQFI
ncbi:MAG: SLC13 family permease [Flavobacteriales bacterium]